MIKIKSMDYWGVKHAIRGMRNPMNSWDKSDSETERTFILGEKDLELMKMLYTSGTEHRKYLRQIFVSMDIIAPLYWWKQFDTYKIGITSNSCSTMHTIMQKPFEAKDFSFEKTAKIIAEVYISKLIELLNDHIEVYQNYDKYIEIGFIDRTLSRKDIFDSLIQILPASYNQLRTVTMNYENVVNIINQRTNHKLDEWKDFVRVLKSLPYIQLLTEREE